MKPNRPIDSMAYTMALYPNIGLRENTETNCEQKPIAGRIAMYTPGCPKNQNRCCHKSGEPPLCAASCPFTTTSGTKKLVPALRSNSSNMPAENSTPNASSPRIAVMNHAQHVSGMRIMDMPLARISSVVVMKFSALINAPTQNNPMLMTHKSAPAPSPGPADGSALTRGDPVHPCSWTRPTTKEADSITLYPINVTQNESMFKTGKAMSAAPILMGRK